MDSIAENRPAPDLRTLAALLAEGRREEAIRAAVALLDDDPANLTAWNALRRLPVLEHPEAAGLTHLPAVTEATAAAVVGTLLADLEAAFHPGRLAALCEIALRYGVPVPPRTLARHREVGVLARRVLVPPQDFPAEDVVRVERHGFQPWVHTHNRPDIHRKPQQPLDAFLRVRNLQTIRHRSPDKPEFGFDLFDGDHNIITQDTFWLNGMAAGKRFALFGLHGAAVFDTGMQGWIREPVVFIPNRDNYYHFLMEALPAAFLVPRVPTFAGRSVVFTRLVPWQRECLEMIGFPMNRIVELQTLPSWEGLDRLGFRDAYLPIEMPFALACDIARACLPAERTMRRGKRIVISRAGGGTVRKRLENEEELARALEERGFVRVITENLTFRDEIDMFADAEIVVGVHGAGNTNILHAPREATLIELMNPACHLEARFNFSSMQRITQSLGQNYIRVLCAYPEGYDAAARADGWPFNHPMVVSIPDVMRAVDVIDQQNACRG